MTEQWNSKQAFALRWIEQQNSPKGFGMGGHNRVFEIYQKQLLYISHLKVRAKCIACPAIQIRVFKKWCRIKCVWILKQDSENGAIVLATDWYASSKQTGERVLKLAPVSASILSIMRSQIFPPFICYLAVHLNKYQYSQSIHKWLQPFVWAFAIWELLAEHGGWSPKDTSTLHKAMSWERQPR